jgi:Ca2+-dependent lipid-binding protein
MEHERIGEIKMNFSTFLSYLGLYILASFLMAFVVCLIIYIRRMVIFERQLKIVRRVVLENERENENESHT